ncbi:hypothetical protein Sjap_026647 [Stephania japonica]|uniref:Uncharacterized protein n=1 Tax=Stephania japonica TaxID=461633 RepID=A0AAP0HB02_9MAGN
MSVAATSVVFILSTSTPAYGSRSSGLLKAAWIRVSRTSSEGLEEDYMVPQAYLIMIKYINVGEAQGGTIKRYVHVNSFSSDFCDIDTQEVLIQAAFNSPDDREPNAGVEVERMTTTEVAAADMDADVEEELQCDFNTTHPDVVALPNVESMVETTEVLEEEEGVDWLHYFPQFEPADLEFNDWEADAWNNEFALGLNVYDYHNDHYVFA